ncbi:hypothetical protein HMPREF1487_09503 [Pseudomonas sp. HPB0071]|uniref:Site-specific recombinase, phage integrase family n=2 Tax=Pseudomonas TaxID=286 RepID=A0A2X2BYD4_PSELU|nr:MULTISPECIES: site-specific integrase [Pseudomonas]ENA27024.1 hypothetical protein HMPREF1487_09503 [Pseudomonas sp. HPB0071]MBA1250146.1 tyrosine-type recombinase/integrase [Pseudomonas zeshuii]MBH3440897.1 tyrosine-type recombinase/integrase [Pseudomonas luteola]SPZ00003.1 site-specific recombinase, phage integrase family [Pseudomonas luteola]
MHELAPALAGSSVSRTVTPPTQAEVAKALRSFYSGFNPNSRVTIKYALSRCAEDLGFLSVSGDLAEVPWHALTPESLHHLIDHWRGNLSVRTIRLYLFAVRGVARACYMNGLMGANTYALIREVKMPRGINKVGRGRSVELQYREALIENCMQDERIQGIRDAALIAMFFGTGVRRAEAASVLDEDINLEEGEMAVRVKGGDSVMKYLAAWSLPYLAQWRQVRRRNGLFRGSFFCGIGKNGKLSGKALTGRGVFYLLEQRSIMAGLPFLVRPHDARRTLGTEILAEHGELVAQRVLGHASLTTTRIYDKRSDSLIKDIFKAKS